MDDKRKGIIAGVFVSDALALGAHWVYKTENIDSKAGRVTDFIDPIASNFHPQRTAGEFTHYGDQMLLIYNHILSEGSFSAADYISSWVGFYDSYDGYIDHAMRQSRENISKGITPSGSDSTDFAGVMYVPFLTALNADNTSAGIEEAVRLTHSSDITVESALFLHAVLADVLEGAKPVESIKKHLNADYLKDSTKQLIESGLDSIGKETRESIFDFGPSCPAESCLPGAVHIVGSYENDFEAGLIENATAGGDSAARAIFAASVLGAYHGFSKIPERWLKDLKADISI